METSSEKPKITPEQIAIILQNIKEIKNLHFDEPPMNFLTREGRNELWTKIDSKTATPEEIHLYENYMKSKFRKNWLHKSLLYLETVYQTILKEEFPLDKAGKDIRQIIQDYGETPEYVEKIRPYIGLINEHLDMAIKKLDEQYGGGIKK